MTTENSASERPFFPPSSRILVGLMILLLAPGLSYVRWHFQVREPLQTIARIEQNRQPGDSAVYADALYHASHARALQGRKWSLGGYATIGLVGTLVGLALVMSARRWTASR